MDDLVGYIEQKMIKMKLMNRVNVVFLSDHGMDSVHISNFIDLTEFIADDTYNIYGSSPVLQIVPKDKSNLFLFQNRN